MTEAKKPLSFEEGLAQLEALVESLEDGKLGLEDGVEKYRRGVKVLTQLRKELEGAEQRVEKLSAVLQEALRSKDSDEAE
jgi:exodeoxyribonuclease VII small subunit